MHFKGIGMIHILTFTKSAFLAIFISFVAFFVFSLSAESVFAQEDEYVYCNISYNGKILYTQAYTYRDTPFIQISVLSQYGDSSTFSADFKKKKVNIVLKNLNIYMGDAETTEFIKSYGGTIYIPIKTINETACVALDTICQFVKLGYSVQDSTIYLVDCTSEGDMGRLINNIPATASSLKEGSGKNISLAKGDVVFIRAETFSYYKIETLTGEVAYIMKDDIHIPENETSLLDYQYIPKVKPDLSSHKINIAWHYVGKTTPFRPEANGGIDVLAPTWFHQIVDGDGNVENYGDLGYTRVAHNNNFYVWATITNNMSTSGSTNYTTKVLSDTALRNKTIAQYLFYACLYDIDGLNIDYEDVKKSDRNQLTIFTQTMRKYTEKLGITLSIDTLIPATWNVQYDYEALGKTVDYIAVMSYDEHYANCPVAGSVASLPWVSGSIEELLTYVPGSKILMGIPLYARLWTVSSAGKTLNSKALSMESARELLQSKGLQPEWISKTGQYYAEYPEGSNTYKIWIEDMRSIAGRTSLVYTYDLAGSACWQYTQGDASAWEVFEAIYKKGISPGSFNEPY
jgi:spore germination protein YaaH